MRSRESRPTPELTAGDWQAARAEIGTGLLSIVMPAHNLGDAIAENIQRVAAHFEGHVPYEIVAVDDGSDDDTRVRIEEAAARTPNVRAVHLDLNAGKGAALRQGFDASRGSHIALLDGDLELSPTQLPGFFEIMREERADIVIGSKRHPRSELIYPWYRVLVSAVYYGLVKLMIGLPVHDTQTGIKLFKREALRYVLARMLVKRFAFDLEILAIAHEHGYRIAEGPVKLEFHSTFGCFRPSTVKQVLKDTLAVFYRLRFLRYYQTVRDTFMPAHPPLVSVVVACPAPTEYLDECLAGLRAQKYRPFEVLILPDAPSGRAWDAFVREIPTGRLRPAEKRNAALTHARGELLAFLDDDTAPSEEWLQRAVPHFGDPAIAAVGGPAVTPASDPFLAQLGGRVYSNRLVSGGYRYRYEPDRVREVDDFPSCNLLVRADVFRELGGFRVDFWPGEDTYLCQEIVHRLKRTILYDPWATVFHHRRKLLLPHLRQVGRYALHRGYFARHFPATSRRVAYALPSLFVVGLVAGGILAAAWPPIRPFYGWSLAAYAAITLLGSFPLGNLLVRFRLHPVVWLGTWVGVVATHGTYGVRFLQGLFTRRLPGEARPFDHPSERPGRDAPAVSP